jgi:hypothetical protein
VVLDTCRLPDRQRSSGPMTKKRRPHWTIVFIVYPVETDLKRADTEKRELLGTKIVVKTLL